MSNIVFYRCAICGNISTLLEDGGGEMSCCGEVMTKLEADIADDPEKTHRPYVYNEKEDVIVQVGAVPNPMLPEHHIQWIVLDTGEKTEIRYLVPGMEPKVVFPAANSGSVFAYCNLHGLWKEDFET